eukprot:COSAG02_NODE_2111_length_9804_cov_5.586296_2_plen_980_part_00
MQDPARARRAHARIPSRTYTIPRAGVKRTGCVTRIPVYIRYPRGGAGRDRSRGRVPSVAFVHAISSSAQGGVWCTVGRWSQHPPRVQTTKMVLISAMVLTIPSLAADVDAVSTVTLDLDGAQHGRVFDGIGALSAGATSRLLPDYPEPQRSQILDLLFARAGGAALHWLKVEIGGDTQSTCGTEPSPMRDGVDGTINIHRGYETWLMQQAVRRNPDIRLYALSWGFPAWVGQGACERAAPGPPLVNGGCSNDVVAADPLSSDRMAKYHAAFVNAAAKKSLNISWVGLWNEDSWTPANAQALRDALDSGGYQATRISAPDQGVGGGAKFVQTLANTSDSRLRTSIDAISVHYPKTISTEPMRSAPLPIWSSEDWSLDGSEAGAGCLARSLNWNYVEGLYTATIVWSLVTAIPKFVPFYGTGLLAAGEPWSGHFNQSAPIFVIAHYTQFTAPGWKYLAHGNGTGWLPGGGSLTTLLSADGKDFTVVLETMTRGHSLCKGSPPPHLPDGRRWPDKTQQVSLRLSSLPIPRDQSLFRWESRLFIGNKTVDPTEHYSTLFIQKPSVLVADDGRVTLDMPIDTLVTLTTVAGGRKDSDASPPSEPFPAQYSDSFGTEDGYEIDQMPRYWSDHAGSFAISSSAADADKPDKFTAIANPEASDLVLQQQVEASPSFGGTGWHNRDSEAPISIIGDYTAASTRLSVRARIAGRGSSPPPPPTSIGPIVSASSEYCLSVGPGNSVVDGANIVVWKCINKASEQWAFNTTKMNTQVVAQSSKMCLSTLCPSLRTNGSVCQRKCDSAALSQHWNVSSDKTFSISQYGACLTSGALNEVAWTTPCSNNTTALWTRPRARTLPSTFVAIALRVGGNLTCTDTFPRNTPGCMAAAPKMTGWMQHGIYFVVSEDGTWSILSGMTVLASDTGPALSDGWHTLELRAKGTVVTALLDEHEVGTVRDSVFQRGWAALSSGFHLAEFANFSLIRDNSGW